MSTWYVVRSSDNYVWCHTEQKWAFCVDGLYEVQYFGYKSSGAAMNRLRALRQRDGKLLGRDASGKMQLLTRKQLFALLNRTDPSPDPEPEPSAPRRRAGPTKAQQRRHALAQAAGLKAPDGAFQAVVF